MTTVHIRAVAACDGGEHVTIRADLDGGPPQQTIFSVADMMQTLTAEDVASTILPIIQLHARGLTRAQLRADLQAGLTVVI